ncbi:MAG: hypothetical protein ACTSYR_05225, partial [Candidatus Odinarchaeia archaeon]
VLKKYITVHGVEYCLYGKSDVIFEGKIIDIKTTKKYSRPKYANSFQHKMYCFITGIPEFEYVVAEWDVFPKIKAVHRVKITSPADFFEQEVITTVMNVRRFLADQPELLELYNTTFSKY